MTELRIAFHGVSGHQITHQLSTLTRARLTAVSGVRRDWLETTSKDHPAVADARRYDSLDELLASGDADLISFCSGRRANQAQECVQALRAGVHVLAEKPMATTMSDLVALRQAVADSGKELRTMTTMIYQPALVGLRDVIARGEIGEVVQVYAMKSYPYHDRRPQDPAADGGLLMQAGIHAVGFVRFATGHEFTTVAGLDSGVGNPGDGDLKMAASISGRLSNGALASIVCNYCNPRELGFWGNDQLRIHGTAGMIELVDGFTRRQLALNDEPAKSFPDVEPNVVYPQDLVDCILDGTPTLLSMEDSFRNTEVVLRAQESANTGCFLDI